MLLKTYSIEIFRPECNPGFESVHSIAHLDQNIELGEYMRQFDFDV